MLWQSIGVFVLRAGVAGVAYPSLIARTFSAVMITVLCFQRKNEVFYRCKWIFRWNVDFMKQILKIAIPNGMENGVFQLVKVALSSIVALFWNISDCSKWRCTKYLVTGCPGGSCYESYIYNGDRTGMEMGIQRRRMIILRNWQGLAILLSSAWNLFDFSSDSILYEILCFAAGDQTACNLAGFNP